MIFFVLSLGGTITLCFSFCKTSKSLLAKAFWIILMIILVGLLLIQ